MNWRKPEFCIDENSKNYQCHARLGFREQWVWHVTWTSKSSVSRSCWPSIWYGDKLQAAWNAIHILEFLQGILELAPETLCSHLGEDLFWVYFCRKLQLRQQLLVTETKLAIFQDHQTDWRQWRISDSWSKHTIWHEDRRSFPLWNQTRGQWLSLRYDDDKEDTAMACPGVVQAEYMHQNVVNYYLLLYRSRPLSCSRQGSSRQLLLSLHLPQLCLCH